MPPALCRKLLQRFLEVNHDRRCRQHSCLTLELRYQLDQPLLQTYKQLGLACAGHTVLGIVAHQGISDPGTQSAPNAGIACCSDSVRCEGLLIRVATYSKATIAADGMLTVLMEQDIT